MFVTILLFRRLALKQKTLRILPIKEKHTNINA